MGSNYPCVFSADALTFGHEKGEEVGKFERGKWEVGSGKWEVLKVALILATKMHEDARNGGRSGKVGMWESGKV
jgi:hypothetical protein